MDTDPVLTNEVIEERHQFISTIKEFVDEKKAQLEEVLSKLGLSYDEISKVETKKQCPYNSDHVVFADRFERHVKSCKLLAAGYQKDELEPVLQDEDFWYKNCEKIMKVEIDENQLNKIIWDSCVQNGQVYTGHRTMPTSYVDENIMLTQEDRLAVYNHVVNTSREAGKVLEVDKNDEQLTTDWGALVKKGLLDEQSNKQYSSKLEQLAALRDLKRRRQSYRAKNVHITKKSYTEIIREVIVNQMEILKPPDEMFQRSPIRTDIVKEEFQDDTSSERSQSRSKYRERDSSPRRRDRKDREAERRERERSPRSHKRSREDRFKKERRFKERSSEDRESIRRERADDVGRKKRDDGDERDRDETSGQREQDREYSRNSETEGRSRSVTDDINIKQEVLSDEHRDDSPGRDNKYKSANSKRRKRSRSASDSEGSDDRGKQRHKHKKSKHKKKQSKKHKRKD